MPHHHTCTAHSPAPVLLYCHPHAPPVPQGGILALDLSPAGEAVVATAGGDSTVQLFDRAAERVLASLTGHSRKVYGEWGPQPCPGNAAAWAKLGGHSRAGWLAGRLGSADYTALALAGRLNIPCFLFSTPADVKFVGSQEVLASGSADKTTKLWRAEGGKYSCAHTFRWAGA